MNPSNFTPTFKNVVLIAQAPQDFYRLPLLEQSDQLFVGPDVTSHNYTVGQHTRILRLHPELNDGRLLNAELRKNGFVPELIFIKADATKRVNISNLHYLPGRKVLLMGDTHHMHEPLKTMLHYALSEPFDLISSEHDRHHLSLFREAGLQNIFWLPCFTMNPYMHQPIKPVHNSAVFVGSLSKHHIHRRALVNHIKESNIPLSIAFASQKQAAKLYNSHAVSLNVSLNADLNFRIMEILAAGGCLLTDRLGAEAGLNHLLTENVHYLAYSSFSEAATKIKFLINEPDHRQKIAEAGYKRFWNTFSPVIQSQVLLNIFDKKPIPELFQAPN